MIKSNIVLTFGYEREIFDQGIGLRNNLQKLLRLKESIRKKKLSGAHVSDNRIPIKSEEREHMKMDEAKMARTMNTF